MNELLSNLLEDEFEDTFEPTSEEEVSRRKEERLEKIRTDLTQGKWPTDDEQLNEDIWHIFANGVAGLVDKAIIELAEEYNVRQSEMREVLHTSTGLQAMLDGAKYPFHSLDKN